MTKTSPVALGVFVAALVFVGLYAVALSAHADVRGSERDRTVAPAPGPAAPPTLPTFWGSGSISNSTTGSADSGGNTGGTVTTGDELVEVFVVNIGPTNNPPPPPPPPTPAPSPRPGRSR